MVELVVVELEAGSDVVVEASGSVVSVTGVDGSADVGDGSTEVEDGLAGRVVVLEVVGIEVVVVEARPEVSTPSIGIGVVTPWCGFHPAGGLVWDGTGPAPATTDVGAGWAVLGGACGGTGVVASCTRPNPAKSDHQIDETCTTVPV